MRPNDLDYPASRPGYLNDACCELPTGLVVPKPVDPTGRNGPTRHQAAGPRFRQTSPGLYVPADVDATVVEQRILEQGMRIQEPRSRDWLGCSPVARSRVLRWHCGRAYAATGAARGRARKAPEGRPSRDQSGPDRAHGVHADRWDPRRLRPAGAVRRDALRLGGACGRRGDGEGRSRPHDLGLPHVAICPAAPGMDRRRTGAGCPRSRQERQLLAPGDRTCASVWEIDAGLPPPLCNVPVFDLSGRLLGIPDLLDPVAGVVGEYNGADHKRLDRRRSDNAREERFRAVGLEYFDLVEGDLLDRRDVVRRMHQTRAPCTVRGARGSTLDVDPAAMVGAAKRRSITTC